MTENEIYSSLVKYQGIDRLVLIRTEYKGTDEGFKELILTVYNKQKKDYLFKYYEILGNYYLSLDRAEDEGNIERRKNVLSQIESHEKTAPDPFLFQLKEDIENYFNGLKVIPFKTDDKPAPAPPEPKYKGQNLFKVGMLFATGKMNKYFELGKDNRIIPKAYTAPAIAKDFENSVNHEYIKASLRGYKDNHNIFNSYEMMTNIINHCKAENIPIEQFFMEKYSRIEHYQNIN